MPLPSPARSAASRRMAMALLEWFPAAARDLPWRRTRDAYAIWISEIMLQQTQVATVIPYWLNWIKRFPTVQALAAAPLEHVLKAWAGLGYYARAKNLHRAARRLQSEHQGRFPESFEQVLALPGVGRYTAGAVCSIAFGQPHPVVDGNAARVLARFFGIGTSLANQRTRNRLWGLAEKLVQEAAHQEPGGCGLFNQALMELGALVCTPKQANCPECPVAKGCVARAQGLVHRLPRAGKRPPPSARFFVAVVLKHRRSVFVRQRREGGWNGALWEFPNIEVQGLGPVAPALRSLLGFEASGWRELGMIKHSITRYRCSVRVLELMLPHRRLAPSEGGWVTPNQLAALAFPSAHGRIAARYVSPV